MLNPPIPIARQMIRYFPERGEMFWRCRTKDMFSAKGQLSNESLCRSFNARYAGKPALQCIDKGTGYRCGNLTGTRHQAHRVLWALTYGYWPTGDIDHINGAREDNRIDNLRLVSRSDNLKNMRLLDNNTSGFTGVYWAADRNKWRAELSTTGRRIKIGSFDTIEQAIEARKEANIKYGFHPNHGMR